MWVLFKLLGQDIRLTFSTETGVRENELTKQLFLDLLSWAWMVPIFLKNSWYSIFFKRTRLEKKLWLFGMFKFGTSIKYWLNVLAISAWFYHLQKNNFRKYFDLIWRFRFYHFPKNSVICHLLMSRFSQKFCFSFLKRLTTFLHCLLCNFLSISLFVFGNFVSQTGSFHDFLTQCFNDKGGLVGSFAFFLNRCIFLESYTHSILK